MKRTQRLTRIVAIIAGLATLAFLIVGAIFHWAWAGFDKPLYDWMQLLIIPVVLALIAVWFNRIDKKNELTVASDNQQEAALQNYLDKLSELLLDRHLRTLPSTDESYHEVRNVARVRTLNMLYQLNARRTNYMLAFLRESGLVTIDPETTIITFSQAHLRDANISGVDLYGFDLSGTDLSGAKLSGAKLSEANLSFTFLVVADLSRAILKGAKLSEADLRYSNLSEAKLSGAKLSGAKLSGAIIDKANLVKANVAQEQVATMKIVSQ